MFEKYYICHYPELMFEEFQLLKSFDCFLNTTSPLYSILMETQILSIKQLSVLKQSIQEFIVEFRNKMTAFNGIFFRHYF